MRDYINDVILDEEIEAPIFVDAGMPKVLAFIVFLGAKGRVSEISAPEISSA
jgi:hypothetical protein